MLEVSQIEEILKVGHETAGFEFKTAGDRSDKYFLAKITRAALSLGNLRDGGYILIGIDDDDPAAGKPGLDQAQIESWLDYDNVARAFAVYADPPLRFEVAPMKLSSGCEIVTIHVHEFLDVPHICVKAFDQPSPAGTKGGTEKVLRDGAVYVRPRKVPETSEIATSIEMRDLLDLATDKGVQRFVERANRAGLPMGSGVPGPSDDDRFAAEREASWL